MKVLFVGEAWLGSCARSLRDALARRPDVDLDELGEDSYFPHPRARWLRAVQRLTAPAYLREFRHDVLARVRDLAPDVVMTYKGWRVHPDLLREIRARGVMTVNVYPDYSPHAFGPVHRAAVGTYDLVVSTKPFHPPQWRSLYGYANRCEFVPQGYDPGLHLVATPPAQAELDVVMVASWRPEYGRIADELARRPELRRLRVAIGGAGWIDRKDAYPRHWQFPGGVLGRRYVEWLRKGKVCLAPIHTEVVIDGKRHPGDVDTTRTYELAAAHCFFLHRRTAYVRTVYDEATEVPMFDDPAELADQLTRYLGDDAARARMAAAAHRRAVPAYSMDQRAADILRLVERTP